MNNDEIFKFLMKDAQAKNKYENQSMFTALITLLEDKGIMNQAEFNRYLENSKNAIKDKMINDVSKSEREYIELREWLERGNNERR